MEKKYSNKILSPRQAEVRRMSGDSIESVVSGASGMYESFAKSLRKARGKIVGAMSNVFCLMFPPMQINMINREPYESLPKLPPMSEFMKRPLPVSKPLHSDSGTSAPTPGRFEPDPNRFQGLEPPNKKVKIEELGLIPFKSSDKVKMATPVWKKYQFKMPERVNFNNNKKLEIKVEEPEAKVLEMQIGNERNEGKMKENEGENMENEGKRMENEGKSMENEGKNVEKSKNSGEEKGKVKTEPNSSERKNPMSEREIFHQHFKALYQSKHQSEEKKPISPEINALETDSNRGISDQKLEFSDQKTEFSEKKLEFSEKKLEQTPDFGKNPEKKTPRSEFISELSIPEQKTEEKKDPTIKPASFFLPDNEKKLPDMDEGFQKGSNPSEKSSPNGKSSISVEEIEKKAPSQNSKIFPFAKPESHSPSFPKLVSPGKNPFLSSNNREQVKPVYVFGSSSSSITAPESFPSVNPFASSKQENPINSGPFIPSNISYVPTSSSLISVSNPFATSNPNISSGPFTSSSTYVQNNSSNSNIVPNNPFGPSYGSNNSASAGYVPNLSMPANNPFASSVQNNPFAPTNTGISTSNPFAQNPYSANPPISTSAINPFSSNNTYSNTSNSYNASYNNPSQYPRTDYPITTGFSSSNPFQSVSNNSQNHPFPNQFQNTSNLAAQNPFGSSNPSINPRPPMYSSTYSSNDIEMNPPQSGAFNIGSIPTRNIIRARKPK